MDYSRQTVRTLHDDHIRTIMALERLEGFLSRCKPKTVPDFNQDTVISALDEFAQVIESEIGAHFSFEEGHLFPKLVEAGDVGITAMLTEEHNVILPLGQKICALAKQGRSGGLDAERWREFFIGSHELIERMVSHIQKEEMGVLPVLDDIIDETDDGELSMIYAAAR